MRPEERERIVQAARKAATEAPPMSRAMQAQVAAMFGLTIVECDPQQQAA